MSNEPDVGAGGAQPSASPPESGPGGPDAPVEAPQPRHESPRGPVRRLLDLVRETAIVVVLALVLSSLVKTFLLQPFWIPSDSMNDTLIRDDRVIVSKLTPGPFDLARGDVVVFEDPGGWLADVPALPKGEGLGQKLKDGLAWVGVLPSQEDNHLIKRVIGLPGDHVRCCSDAGKLEVNGVAINETYVFPGDKPSAFPFDIHVPAGKVWVMGDHRSNSRDSRYNDVPPGDIGGPGLPGGDADGKEHTGYYGSVPIDRVVGRAVAIVWPLGRATGLGGQSEVFGSVPAPGPSAAGERRAGVVAAGSR